MKIFLIVFSIWAYEGGEWKYTGNQYVHTLPMTQVECNGITHQRLWQRHESNPNLRLSVECVEQRGA